MSQNLIYSAAIAEKIVMSDFRTVDSSLYWSWLSVSVQWKLGDMLLICILIWKMITWTFP